MAGLGAPGCADITPLDVALGNLNLRVIKKMSVHHLGVNDISLFADNVLYAVFASEK